MLFLSTGVIGITLIMATTIPCFTTVLLRDWPSLQKDDSRGGTCGVSRIVAAWWDLLYMSLLDRVLLEANRKRRPHNNPRERTENRDQQEDRFFGATLARGSAAVSEAIIIANFRWERRRTAFSRPAVTSH